MFYLILCIVVNAAIFVVFKSYSKFGINTFQAIVSNYIVCVVTGVSFVYYQNGELVAPQALDKWGLIVIPLGGLFILTFYLIAMTTQRLNITIATISTKMSLIIPVIFSLFIFKYQGKQFSALNYIGLFIAVLSIVLASIPSGSRGISNIKTGWKAFVLPLAVFCLGGILDTTMNYCSKNLLPDADKPLFTTALFGMAGVIGLLVALVQYGQWDLKSIVGGIFLGVPNYFSIFYLLKSLEYFNNDGAITYTIINIGIILLSSLFSIFLFKERLIKLNYVGILLAILAIVFISYQEILSSL